MDIYYISVDEDVMIIVDKIVIFYYIIAYLKY